MKTKEELTQLKEEYKTLTTKLKRLNEGELKQVVGGRDFSDFENEKIGFLR